MKGSKIPQYLMELEKNWPRLALKYTRSPSLEDVLFRPDCIHIEKPDTYDVGTSEEAVGSEEEEDNNDGEAKPCIKCDQTKIIRRKPRDMRVHYGLIASGNQVIKDAIFRDQINAQLGGKVLCFEMEAAGLMNDFPCIVIRGICDYADSHNNKRWQEHAAAVAAAFAKELLLLVPAWEVEQMDTIKVLRGIERQLERVSNTVNDFSSHHRDQEHQAILDWLTPVKYASQQHDFIAQRQKGTGEWLLQSKEFQQWLTQSNQTLFCPGIPGAGKTIIMSIVVDHLYRRFGNDPTIGKQAEYDNLQAKPDAQEADHERLKATIQAQRAECDKTKETFDALRRTKPRIEWNEEQGRVGRIIAGHQAQCDVLAAMEAQCNVLEAQCNAMKAETETLRALNAKIEALRAQRAQPKSWQAFKARQAALLSKLKSRMPKVKL
ncbi:hypothetical protein IFM61392_09176 [Aspergillus lentulus]|nr:hypothetical protein IFM61392_09176 [Aspergillus lentulus]